MITELILDLFFGLFNLIVAFLPTFSFGADMATLFVDVVAWFAWVNYYIPLEDFFMAAMSVFGIYIPLAVFNFLKDLF